MRALGYWLLPEPEPTPIEPRLPTLKRHAPAAVRLPQEEWDASGESAGLGALLNALQRLALFAAVSSAKPQVEP